MRSSAPLLGSGVTGLVRVIERPRDDPLRLGSSEHHGITGSHIGHSAIVPVDVHEVGQAEDLYRVPVTVIAEPDKVQARFEGHCGYLLDLCDTKHKTPDTEVPGVLVTYL